MKPESVREFFANLDELASKQSSPMEYEFAYQARVAIEHIRFAIKETERKGHDLESRQIAFRLLDALDRLESADRAFQVRFRSGKTALQPQHSQGVNGSQTATQLCK